MIILDTALAKREAEGRPVRVALVGAGAMGRGIAVQIAAMQGMQLVAIANRTPARAEAAYAAAGTSSCDRVGTASQLDASIAAGRCAITDDAAVLCESASVEVILEATGDVDYGTDVAVRAIDTGKHLVLMNAEVDSLIGPLLKARADRAGVVYSNADGDQPGVVMNLFRFVRTLGYGPVLVGNMKGMLDHYRTPETQQGFAAANAIDVHMATSFADGTKLSMEQAVIANATGFKVSRRGMYGPACRHVNEAAGLFPLDELLDGGRVDYILGAEPGPGVFVLGYDPRPSRQQLMRYFKMGDGPLYVFYVPYHLPHLEAPLTAARAVLFGDAAVTPLGPPVCDVVAVAKRDLRAGEILDGIGGFTCYGDIENAEVTQAERLLPMSLSGGCLLLHDIRRDTAIRYADVEGQEELLSWRLRAEQDQYFFPAYAGGTIRSEAGRQTARATSSAADDAY